MYKLGKAFMHATGILFRHWHSCFLALANQLILSPHAHYPLHYAVECFWLWNLPVLIGGSITISSITLSAAAPDYYKRGLRTYY